MSTTLQTQALQIANTLINISQSLYQLENNINLISTQFTQLTLGNVFNAMPTTAVNADGSLGTADATPVSGHVIDTRLVPGLNRAISATDLATLNTLAQAVAQLLSGGTVPAQQGEAPQLLNKIYGG